MNPARRWIRKQLYTYAPAGFDLIRKMRRRLHDRAALKYRDAHKEVYRLFIAKYGPVVQAGPFSGMKHVNASTGSPILPKLIGAYECELWKAIEAAVELRPPVVVDIGCDEGYYAVGFAMRLNSATVYAFDTNERAQDLCKEMARLNGFERNVVVGGHCSHSELNHLLVPNALLFSDCEGFEYDLLDPVKVPLLVKTVIIVELHDHERVDVEITPAICTRFRYTHDITVLKVLGRNLRQFPSVDFLSVDFQKVSLMENRVKSQQWAFMTPKKHA